MRGAFRASFNKQNDGHQNDDFAQHGPHLRLKNFVEDPKAKGRRHAPRQLSDAAEHHHQERVDNVTLAQFRPDVAQLGERHAA